jgi:hypothetical protein
MSIVSRLFGTKYNDSQLLSHARVALESDPLLTDVSSVVVASRNGVISLNGKAPRLAERDRIEGVIRTALRTAGLKFERIENELEVA